MKTGRILSLALTGVALLGIAVALSSCCDPPTQATCPQGECWMWEPENFGKCNYSLACDDTDTSEPCYPYNLRNTGKHFVVFGDSIAAGGWCYEEDQGGEVTRCGFREPLESLLADNLIAGFGTGGHTAKNEVNGWDYPGIEGQVPGFAIVDRSVEKNPGVKRTYIHIGGNDILYWVQAHLGSVPMPPACALDTNLTAKISEVVNTYIRQIVERYIYTWSVPEVVVGSVHRLEINKSTYATSCYQMFCPKCQECYQCMNHVLAEFSSQLSALVTDLNQEYRNQHPGSPDVVFLADHFAGFGPTNPGNCTISCDCVHLNCSGHTTMADIWWQARPQVPSIP